MAEAGAADLDQHLALARRIEIDLGDMDGLGLREGARRPADRENGSLHFHYAIPPSTRTSDPVVKLDLLEAR